MSTPPFLETAIELLGLTDAEFRSYLETGVRSFDTLHSLLRARAALDEADAARAKELLGKLQDPGGKQMLSDAYMQMLAGWRPPPNAGGVTLARPAEPPGQAIPQGPPKGWPSLGKPAKLGANDEVDLLGDVAADWGVRDQLGQPTCVGFAAAATLEILGRRQNRRTPTDLSGVFLYQRIRAQGSRAFNAASGNTKLGEARKRLAEEGVCTARLWGDTKDPTEEPSATAKRDAERRVVAGTPTYFDLGVRRTRPPGVARTVRDLLAQGRPVAISLPQFSLPGSAAKTAWEDAATMLNGEIATPVHVDRVPPAAHAVCIFAFQHDPHERTGGWFIFRNSVGTDFACNAPMRPRGQAPYVPDRGYGAITATYVERFLWEIYSPPADGD